MRIFNSKTLGVIIVIAMLFMYGCDQSLNSETANGAGKSSPIPTGPAVSTSPNDGLHAVDYTISPGSDFATAGTGTQSRSNETISVDVPSGATVSKVFLYWARRPHGTDNLAAPTIEVEGNLKTGVIAGGPVAGAAVSYRVDLSSEGLVTPGANTITVKDDPGNSSEPLGASVLVLYTLPAETHALSLFDGVDFLYARSERSDPDLQQELRTAVPVTFNFNAAAQDRTAKLRLFIGDIESGNRPNSLKLQIGSTLTTIGPPGDQSPFQSYDGPQWDNYKKTITIPAGVDQVIVYPVSGPEVNGSGAPASMVWSLAGLSVPVPQQSGGGQGCTPGYWKQSQHFDSWVNYDPTGNILDDPFDVPGNLELARPEKGFAENITLLAALELRGGKVNALIRHAVAALLNASNPDVSYDLSLSEVQSIFNDAVEDGSKKVIEAAKDKFADFNEQGCPLN